MPVLLNLLAAMSLKKISVMTVAKLIGTTEKTVNNKLNGITDFTVPEAVLIKRNLFPEYDMCYLFAPSERTA